jgi:predicted O-linked N-acetylglucosamine transferase (SPINDLY family)
MGTDYMDYLLADRFVVPEQYLPYYAEQVVYLPDCFQANDTRRAWPGKLPTRSQLHLPQSAFVWCCLNSPFKLNAELFDVWMRLLHAVSDSVLWLVADTPAAERHLRDEAAARGMDPVRLLFAPRVSFEEHLARLSCADLFLDTLPFNAGATASDALWAGLPLITCVGRAFASRMAGSVLRAVGLPELITEDLAQYEQLALELARAPERLAALRRKLAAHRGSEPLFDTRRFCTHLENAYTRMWERSERGEPPAAFAV